MPAPLYARYTPSTANKSKAVDSDSPASSTAQKTAGTFSKPPKEKKKLPKVDRPEKKSSNLVEEGNKHSKKRKRKQVDQEQNLDEENDGLSKRHGALLAKYQRSSKISEKIRERQPSPIVEEDSQKEPSPELHGLTPLPQPPQPPEADYKPTFSALPPWLSKPIIVGPGVSKPFHELRISSKLLANLEKKGFRDAFPVQSALIPLLLPGQDRYHGDICVSAATGSGKTLGYVLPVVEALKENLITRLRAIIVVPTRELVAQARQVAELCATGTGVKLGTALGSTPLANEQRQLVNKGQRFDLDIAKKLNEIAKERFKTGLDEEDSLMEDIQTLLPGHVPEYSSNVDILVCTPGRLVDHIRSTPGFSLSHVEYLIIDEADRLLDESFQEWVEIVLGALEKPDEDSARDRLLYNLEPRRLSKSVRKIILSATMTRDLAKLAMLKLRRPTLVAVTAGDRTPSEMEHGALPREDTAIMEAVDIPPNLREVAIPVRDGTLKPLYLLELLTRLLNSACASTSNAPAALKTRSNASDMVAQEDIDSGAVDSSDSSSETDDSDSDSTSDSETGKRELENIDMPDTAEATTQLEGKGMPTARILVFTNNNEDVMRLSHILSALHLPYARSVGTLTKASSSTGRKTLAAFKSGKLTVLIATDRASRGLDVPDLTDVISYDMPRSVTSYVHRIGRTARAGKAGSAWTFFINTEARWFWNSIARGQEIRRSQAKVERMKIDSQGFEDKMPAYEHALKSLQSSVHGTK